MYLLCGLSRRARRGTFASCCSQCVTAQPLLVVRQAPSPGASRRVTHGRATPRRSRDRRASRVQPHGCVFGVGFEHSCPRRRPAALHVGPRRRLESPVRAGGVVSMCVWCGGSCYLGSRSRWTVFFGAVPAWRGLRRTLWGGAPRAAAASGPVGGAGRGGGSVRTSLAVYRAQCHSK